MSRILYKYIDIKLYQMKVDADAFQLRPIVI